MKNIAVFFNDPQKMDYPFNEIEYWHSYQELAAVAIENNVRFFIVRSQSTYLGNGVFDKSWQFDQGKLLERDKVKIDALYDKGQFTSDGKIPVLNNENINEICTNKWKTYLSFPNFFPKTFLISNESEFKENLQKVSTKIIVIKPVDGAEGKGVLVGNTDYLNHQKVIYPCLIQEFIDSSKGIPHLVEGSHDLRIATINGEIIYSFLRTPPTDSLVANVAQGGQQIHIDIEEIPQEAVIIVKEVDQFLSQFGSRFYGIDLALSPNGFKIIELNSRLGLDENARGKNYQEVKRKIINMLIDLTNQN